MKECGLIWIALKPLQQVFPKPISPFNPLMTISFTNKPDSMPVLAYLITAPFLSMRCHGNIPKTLSVLPMGASMY